MIKKIFIDVETTGTDYRKHSIHHIAGIVELDGGVAEEFSWPVRPHPKAQVTAAALQVCGVDELDLLSYPEMGIVHKRMITLLETYIDRYDRNDKAWLVG